jgi:formylmethanofuran dehydrogenase subunit D
VTKNERITLGQKALDTLHVRVGDNVQIFEENGRVIIAPILPPKPVSP